MALIDEQFPATITVWRKGESIQARHSSLKDVTLPDGTIQRLLRDGAVGKFTNKTTGEDRLKLRWHRKWWPVPTLEEVETWTLDSVCPTPDGDIVEPDHPDAWLSLLGLV
jgi:hypothetical protein